MLALFQIISVLLNVLWWIIVIQAILSWLVAFNVINTYNDFVRSLLIALDRITAPIYRPIRRVMPDLGALDLSPLVVLLLIYIIDGILLPQAYQAIAL
ncbi:MAG: osmotic-shock protein [Sphingomonas sp. SCN 67-18]|uniref:YggT family protein n=1 Tax=uncultured Sphingomonas sp. TaxID=158754 RepID=UPI00086F6D52|nr:YggT family protein [Sphingomonas sp. SCN 67-18]ODU18734.1 MAG: osmotic-shock protein [Sphingomonas sp. SCN 67-18]